MRGASLHWLVISLGPGFALGKEGEKNRRGRKKISANEASPELPRTQTSLSMCAQRKAGRRQRASPAVCTLPMVPCGSSPVTRFALASAMRKTKRLRRRLNPEVVWRRERVADALFPSPGHRSARFARRYFSCLTKFDPVFCLCSPL